jgi:ABC-type polysaccharide/polyol phosphate transport system ATPase subunit
VNAVEFDAVSKNYALYDRPGNRLAELATFGRRKAGRAFPALTDVTFAARKGEVFCIIGANGSGKSTALSLMAGIMQPSTGTVRVTGRVAALLELGSGFHPEFTGRQNVFLNAAILGLSQKEMVQRFSAIAEFAAIGDFIDQPVRTYSSGMAMRLAFAVAASVDPEVLLVDEALAVGDAWFRHKCMRRVHELRNAGVTIVFVSHATAEVRALGDQVLWLDQGRVAALGDAEAVVGKYMAAMADRRIVTAPQATLPDHIPNIDHRHGDGRARIRAIALVDEYGENVQLMTPGMRVAMRLRVDAQSDLSSPRAGFLLRNHLGLDFSQSTTPLAPLTHGATVEIDFRFEVPELYPGFFSFSPYIFEATEPCDWIDNAITVQMARGEGPVYGYFHVPCRVEVETGFV